MREGAQESKKKKQEAGEESFRGTVHRPRQVQVSLVGAVAAAHYGGLQLKWKEQLAGSERLLLSSAVVAPALHLIAPRGRNALTPLSLAGHEPWHTPPLWSLEILQQRY